MGILRFSNISNYLSLIRFHKPIGTYLLIWPSLWALWLAKQEAPPIKLVILFVIGAFLMRSAGCIINDYIDRNLDQHVARTCTRPLATGLVSLQEAMALLLLFTGLAVILLFFLNQITLFFAGSAFVLSLLYPWMKRYTHWPQAILGLAFSHPILMAWTAQTNELDITTGWLMTGTFFWIIAYDTYYAMIDREDDLKIGIRSTAILFGKKDRVCIALLNSLTLICFSFVGYQLNLNIYYFMSLFITASLFGYQYHITQHYDRKACLQAFLSNHWVGCIIFLGILAGLT